MKTKVEVVEREPKNEHQCQGFGCTNIPKSNHAGPGAKGKHVFCRLHVGLRNMVSRKDYAKVRANPKLTVKVTHAAE